MKSPQGQNVILPSLSLDSAGNLKVGKKDSVEPCPTTSEMQIRYCLVRRGLALDQANIMNYHLHDKLTEKLLNARMEEPPTGCTKVSMKQLELADKKFWTLLAELTRDGIKAKAAGRPCDLQFNACFTSPEFLKLLQPHDMAPKARAYEPSLSQNGYGPSHEPINFLNPGY